MVPAPSAPAPSAPAPTVPAYNGSYQGLLLFYSLGESKAYVEAGTTFRFMQDELLDKFKGRLGSEWNQRIKSVRVVKSPVQKMGSNKSIRILQPAFESVIFHAFVVVQTDYWFYSIEKDGKRVLLQVFSIFCIFFIFCPSSFSLRPLVTVLGIT